MGRPAGQVEAEIRLRAAAHRGSFLVVEGSLDSRLLKQFTDPSCRVVMADGKANVLSVVPALSATIPGLLGVVDEDFDGLCGRDVETERILVVRQHDIEGLLFAGAGFDRVVSALGDPDRVAEFVQAGPSIREAVHAAARPLGALRLHNEVAGLGLRFENLDPAHYIDHRTLTADVDELVREVGRKSVRPAIDVPALHAAVQDLLELHPQHLACGHDLMEILSFALRKTIARHNAMAVLPDRLALDFAYALDASEWASTPIARAMAAWEVANAPYRILKPQT